MKYDIELIIFDIKQKKALYFLPLIFIWLIFLPFMISQAQNIALMEGNIYIYFDYLQKILSCFLFYYLFLFFKNILDNEAIETIYAINSKNKIVYLLYIFIIYQLIALPFYLIPFCFFDNNIAISEILNILFILFYLSIFFYCISYYFLSPLVAFGILFVYCFIFMLIFPAFSMFNVFHIGQSISNIDDIYYFKHIVEIIIMLIIGEWKEKRVLL